MKVTDLSIKAEHFALDNDDLSLVSEDGVLIRAIEIDGWLRLVIEVDEDTTSEELRRAIPLALLWRDRLLEWQGPWFTGGATPFFERLCYLHESGISYAEIAERLNQRIGELLAEYYNYWKAFQAAVPNFKTNMDFYLWQGEWMRNPENSNPFSAEHARDILEDLRVPEEEIGPLLKTGLEHIETGLPPFEDGYPLSKTRIRGQLRRWRRGKKHNLLSESHEQSKRGGKN